MRKVGRMKEGDSERQRERERERERVVVKQEIFSLSPHHATQRYLLGTFFKNLRSILVPPICGC